MQGQAADVLAAQVRSAAVLARAAWGALPAAEAMPLVAHAWQRISAPFATQLVVHRRSLADLLPIVRAANTAGADLTVPTSLDADLAAADAEWQAMVARSKAGGSADTPFS